MFVQIDTERNNTLVAWGWYAFPGYDKEFPSIDYEDYCNNPDKYSYNPETIEITLNPNYNQVLLQQEKEKKIIENDTKRDRRLASGVEYKGVMFDCDTDQKANLLGVSQFMGDEDKITWFGMDNKSLLMGKEDMLALGQIIITLTNNLWNYNANVKYQIEQAKNVAEVQKIFIDYDNLPEATGFVAG